MGKSGAGAGSRRLSTLAASLPLKVHPPPFPPPHTQQKESRGRTLSKSRSPSIGGRKAAPSFAKARRAKPGAAGARRGLDQERERERERDGESERERWRELWSLDSAQELPIELLRSRSPNRQLPLRAAPNAPPLDTARCPEPGLSPDSLGNHAPPDSPPGPKERRRETLGINISSWGIGRLRTPRTAHVSWLESIEAHAARWVPGGAVGGAPAVWHLKKQQSRPSHGRRGPRLPP